MGGAPVPSARYGRRAGPAHVLLPAVAMVSLVIALKAAIGFAVAPSAQRLPSASLRPPANKLIIMAAGDSAGVGDAGTTPLMLAAHTNDAAGVRELAAKGADLNAQDSYGWTALRYAVRGRCAEAAEALVALGADVNLSSRSGRTPLMSAAGNGLSGMIRLLLKNGADKAATDKSGRTAYDIAMRGGSTGCTACREMLAKGTEHETVSINVSD